MLKVLSNMTIRAKVIGAFLLVLVVAVGLGLFALERLGAVNDAATSVRDDSLPSTMLTADLGSAAKQHRIIEARHILSTSAAGMEAVEQELKAAQQEVQKLRAEYEPLIAAGAERDLVSGFDRAWREYVDLQVTALLPLSRKNEKEKATELFNGKSRELFKAADKALAELVDFNVREAKKVAGDGEAIYVSARLWIIAALALAALLCVACGWIIVMSVSRPIAAMTGAMRRLAGHDLTVEIGGLGRRDEIGEMAKAVDVFKQNMIRADELAAEQTAEQARKEQRQAAIEGYIATFESGVRSSLDTLASAATEMRATSQGMSATAEETSAQATTVAAAAEQASVNVQTVASATEELSSSVAEIGRQVSESTRIAGQAVNEADRTNTTVQGLSAAAHKIGDVVKLISEIASQTNLLALNATIEAARAGDAGKGFAVVASEVKSLANQTAKATEEISAQVAAMQGATSEAVAAIKSIGGTIGSINEIATTIASAVEEQGAATQEIARNVHEAAQGTGQVSSNIIGVNQAASETGTAANQVLASAEELGRQAETLRGDVDDFLAKIRAA